MKGLTALFLGIFGTLVFSWAGLVWIPSMQIGHLDPQTDEDGADAYPVPHSGMAERGRHIYVANGCVYCHSQQVRADYAGSDIERGWGTRRSAPRDYIFEQPVLLGNMRLGQDLANEGKRVAKVEADAAATVSPGPGASPAGSPAVAASASPAAASAASPAPSGATVAAASPAPSASASPITPSGTTSAPQAVAQNAAPAASPAPSPSVSPSELPYTAGWHHRHLYDPRSVVHDSAMPSYAFLYTKKKVSGQRSADALVFPADSPDAPPIDWEVVPTYDARCLVAYLMSLDQSHPLKEVKGTTAAAPAASPAPAKEAK